MKARYLFTVVLSVLLAAGCSKKTDPLPVVETISPPYLSSKSVTLGVKVTSTVKQSFLNAGIYIGKSPNPEQTASSKFTFGSDTGLFYAVVNGFTPNTTYYVKGYAVNNTGEALGAEVSFTTLPTVTDNDLNQVETVRIGSQTWMGSNLRSWHYRNGEIISTTNPVSLDISDQTNPVYLWYANGKSDSALVYGMLYTWYAVTDSRNICPLGWHLPTDADWTALENNFGSLLIAGSFLKEPGNTHWLSPYNQDASNMSCFAALPAGFREPAGSFDLIQNEAHFWTATESESTKAWERMLSATSYSVTRQGALKNAGLSVRCVKD
jgi:uncharacterized protein (TIGR02145 family)